MGGGIVGELKTNNLEKLPIPLIPLESQKPFEDKAEQMLKLNQSLNTKSSFMIDYIFESFAKYHKPKTQKEARREFEELKTDTDYNKSIPEINRVANYNMALAKKLEKQTSLNLEPKITKVIKNWYEYSPADILTELEKQNIFVPSTIAFEFKQLFDSKAKECQALASQISVLDKQIDAMVYNLYGLTEEEIEVVEGD
jgi:restriction endonuclease S subunit